MADFLRVVEEMTVKDIKLLMEQLFKSPLTMACLGDVARVPRYDVVARRFQK